MADGEQSIFEAPETIGRMLVTTWALLYSMDGDQRRACEFPMADPSRVDWDFVPKPDRQGIPLSRLDAHQRTLAQSLLAAGLSEQGYSQALQIMAMEGRPRDLQRSSDEARRSGRSGVLRPPVDPASPRDHADVCALGRIVTRVCAMTSAVVARLIYQMLLARMSAGQ
jgi:hypothetical protein